jgi:hypothetical protein
MQAWMTTQTVCSRMWTWMRWLPITSAHSNIRGKLFHRGRRCQTRASYPLLLHRRVYRRRQRVPQWLKNYASRSNRHGRIFAKCEKNVTMRHLKEKYPISCRNVVQSWNKSSRRSAGGTGNAKGLPRRLHSVGMFLQCSPRLDPRRWFHRSIVGSTRPAKSQPALVEWRRWRHACSMDKMPIDFIIGVARVDFTPGWKENQALVVIVTRVEHSRLARWLWIAPASPATQA